MKNLNSPLTRDGQSPESMFSIATEFTKIDEQKKEIINTTVEDSLKKGNRRKEIHFRKTGENDKFP